MSKARDLADTVSTGGILDDGTVSVSEISDLTVTAAELNNVAGVNSDVQTQLDLKAPLASPTFTGDATFDTDTLVVDSTNNRVGIGTSSPKSNLDLGLSGSVTSTPSGSYSDYAVALYGSTTSGSIRNFVGVGEASAVAAGIGFVDTGSGGAQGITFNTGNLSSTTERFRISSTGAVGLSGANYGTAGQVLTSSGSGAAPTWADAASGGGSFEATASGAITAGDLVSLNSDGTVSTTSGFAGSPSTFLSSSIEDSAITYDSNSNKVVILYKQGSNSRTYAIVGTVSGTSISYGTATEIATSNNAYHDITFDSNSNKVVIAFRDQSDLNKVKAAVGTVSGTSISFGTIVEVTSQAASFPKLAFDSNSNKVVVAYKDNYDGSVGKAAVGTVSGTSISFGTPVVYQNTNNQPSSNVFDSNSNKIVIGFKHDADSDDGKAVVGTVSGTSISFGTPVTFTTGNGEVHASTFDTNSNKVVIVFRDNNNSGKLSGIVGTVSGTSISFGSTVAISTGSFSDLAVTFDSNINKVIVVFRDVEDTNDGKLVSGTVSGTSISFGTSVTFNDGNISQNSIVFDSSANKVVLAYYNNTTGLSQGLVGIPAGIDNFFKYIGFSSENITDGSTGVINVLGGVNESQSSLNIGSTYYLSDAATLSTTAVTGREVGKALSATKLLITQGSVS